MSFGVCELMALAMYTISGCIFLVWANWRIERRNKMERGQ